MSIKQLRERTDALLDLCKTNHCLIHTQDAYEIVGLTHDWQDAYDQQQEQIAMLRNAAQAVVDRWETPSWKDAPATAGFIYALRDALASTTPTPDKATNKPHKP